MIVREHEPLAPYTSLRVGGSAERLVITETYEETLSVLNATPKPTWILGFGCNVLIADSGLSGITLMIRGGHIDVDGMTIIADAGAWWDDVVQMAIAHNLWGLELMSGIPSSTGAAVYGNIAAYGSQVSDALTWIDVYDMASEKVSRKNARDIQFSYRHSSLQRDTQYVILRAGFTLNTQPMHALQYESALAVARSRSLNLEDIHERRIAIMETRRAAGSLYDPHDPNAERTAGSFFKNPLVSLAQAKQVAAYDETGKTLDRLLEQNKIHGGSLQRASAAHVLLAAGYHRGQRWGNVQLHPSHILKIATHPGATATDVARVIADIKSTVWNRLAIDIEPEVTFVGF